MTNEDGLTATILQGLLIFRERKTRNSHCGGDKGGSGSPVFQETELERRVKTLSSTYK